MIDPPRIRKRSVASGDSRFPDGFHPTLQRILLGRGVTELKPLTLGSLHGPGLLGGIAEAAKLLADAVCESQDILIAGDFDADGATGTALAVLALRDLGASRVRFRVPNRFEFGYGLSPGLVDSLQPEMPDLLVTVDSGIACHDGVKMARDLGSKVIVTDHHLPGDSLPCANAIVNPNCSEDGFPSKALAGVGVMFYVLGAVRAQLRQRGWFSAKRNEPNLARYLDLVALGTVADMVPLDFNNRILVNGGIQRIRAGRGRAGILSLLRAGKRDYRHVVASDLGFTVAPRLNAAGRLEDMSIGIRCLLSEDHEEAGAWVQQLEEYNISRRQMQAQMQDEAMRQLQRLLPNIKENAQLPPCVCLHDPQWHQGIVGLVASKVKDALHRPAIVFAPESEGSDLLKGSGRSVRGMHMRDLLAHVDSHHPDLIPHFGGHAMAAGLTLPVDNLERFKAALDESATALLDGRQLSREIVTDGELSAAELNLDFAQQIRDLGPWGQQFPEPLFEGAFEVLDKRIVGGAHLKMVLRPVDGQEPVDAIAFGTLPENLPSKNALRALFHLDVNHFRGDRSCQLRIEHLVSA